MTQTPNGPKANKGEIKQILNFIKDLLPNYLVNAISFLLYPCCTISGTAIAKCFDYNKFTLTITLDKPLPEYQGKRPIYIFAGGTSTVSLGTYTAPNTITATLFFLGGVTNITQDVSVAILYETSTDGLIGVYHNLAIPGVVFNGNPCD